MELELCSVCDEPTGKAGQGDGSLYCAECETGPLCEAHAVLGDDCFCLPCSKKKGNGPEMRDLLPAKTLQELIALRAKVSKLEERVALLKSQATSKEIEAFADRDFATLKQKLTEVESRVAEVEKERDRAVETVNLQTALNSKLEDKVTSAESRAEKMQNEYETETAFLHTELLKGEKALTEVENSAKGIIRELLSAFCDYEMDVDTSPTDKHRAMVHRALAFVEPQKKGTTT